MIMYVIVRVEDVGGTFTVDPCGIYTDEGDAFDWIEKLEELNKNPDAVVFDALEFEVDEEPPILGSMQTDRQALIDHTDKTLHSLLQRGMIEQLVGEDGKFYYEMTSKGATTMKGIPGKEIKKFIDAKNNREEL